jgi:hypothetical protein
MTLSWLKRSLGKVVKPSGQVHQPQDQHVQNENTLTRCKLPEMLNNLETAANTEKEITKKFSSLRNTEKASIEGWIFKVVTGSDRGRQYIATNATLRIGRKTDNHIYLKDPKVSRYHAIIRIEGNHLFIKDLKSTNGTKINDHAVIGEREIFPGEEIKIGDTVIQLEKITSNTSGAI